MPRTVRNQTSFETRDLRRLIRRAIADDGVTATYPRLTATIHPHRQAQGCRGRAEIAGNHIWLWLGENITARLVLSVMAHELLHIRGLHHRDYGHDPGAHDLSLPDHELPPLRQKAITPQREKPNIRLVRYQRTLEHIAKKQRTMKCLTTRLKKWQQKRRYDERALTAAGLLPAASNTKDME